MHRQYQVGPDGAFQESIRNIAPQPQRRSPLYNKLRTEIRNLVFRFTLRESQNKSKPYQQNRLYYRPGHHYCSTHDTRLLQTCRLIYHEARMMPVALHEFTYWLHGGPVQYCRRIPPSKLQLESLTTEQLAAVQEVHLFAQQCCLEYCYPFSTKIQCKKFKITIRNCDWWSWDSPIDSDDALGICPWRYGEHGRTTWQEMKSEPLEQDLRPRWDQVRAARDDPSSPKKDRLIWGYGLQFIEGLEILEMEFETDITKKPQLENIVSIAKGWRIPMGGDRELYWTGKVQRYTWTGMAESRSDGRYPDEGGDSGQEGVFMAGSPSELEIGMSESQFMSSISASALDAPMREHYVVIMRWEVRQRAT